MGARLRVVDSNPNDVGVAVEQSGVRLVSPNLPGVQVGEAPGTLRHRKFVETASESTGSDWSGVPNFVGAADGSLAELQEGLVLTQGVLIGEFAPQVNRQAWTIQSVLVQSFHRTAGIQLLASALNVQYRNGALGVPVSVEAINNNEDHLGSPRTYDITASGPTGVGDAWTWEAISGLRWEYSGTIVVDLGLTVYQVDAARLIVNATKAATI